MSVQVGIVTALTLISGVAILTVYIFLLKMNGWIGKNSDEIKIIMKNEKPLQETSAKQQLLNGKSSKMDGEKPDFPKNSLSNKKTPEVTIVEAEKQSVALVSASTIPEKSHNYNNFNKKEKINKTSTSTIELKENDNTQTTDDEIVIQQESINAVRQKPEKCKNFLGYLKVHPKSKPLPDECLTCHKLIKCPNEATSELKEENYSQTTNNETIIKQETINTEKERPDGCKNFLGYLGGRPKSNPLPDECFACSRLIDCAVNAKK